MEPQSRGARLRHPDMEPQSRGAHLPHPDMEPQSRGAHLQHPVMEPQSRGAHLRHQVMEPVSRGIHLQHLDKRLQWTYLELQVVIEVIFCVYACTWYCCSCTNIAFKKVLVAVFAQQPRAQSFLPDDKHVMSFTYLFTF